MTSLVLLVFASVCAYVLYVPLVIIYSIKSAIKGGVKKYWHKQAYMIDVLAASALNMKYDTISETIGTANEAGKGNWFTRFLCRAIDLFDPGHCKKNSHFRWLRSG